MIISPDKIVILNISIGDVFVAIDKAKQMTFIDNLRNRAPTVQFDCKVRGYLGEIGIMKWLNSFNIRCWSGSANLDVFSSDVDLNIRGMQKDYIAEIKTSAKPDNWTTIGISTDKVLLQSCLEKGDIKIYARQADYRTDLNRDLYVQVYYGIKTKAHDAVINGLYLSNPSFLSYSANDLFGLFHMEEYLENIYFVGWIDKNSIIQRLDSLDPNDRMYSTGGNKMFWCCGLKDAYPPSYLINYLRS